MKKPKFIRQALHYKIDYADGFRYLDSCGEYLARALEEIGLIPDGDANPQSGKLIFPEKGISVEINTRFFRVSQNFPENDEDFGEFAEFVEKLYLELFKPKVVEKVGLAISLYLPTKTAEEATQLSLDLNNLKDYSVYEKAFGMPLKSVNLESNFEYGSMNLRLKTNPATFTSKQNIHVNIPQHASAWKIDQIKRKNAWNEKVSAFDQDHGLFVDLDLTQKSPPPDQFMIMWERILDFETKIPNILKI